MSLLSLLQEYLSQQLQRPIVLVKRRTYREISVMLLSGQLDAAWISDFPYLKRGLAGIRNVARAALVTYKGGSETNLLTRSDLDDLSLPVQHETGIRRLHLDWHRISEPLAIDSAGVRQITLNLLLNACAASRFGGISPLRCLAPMARCGLLSPMRGQGFPRTWPPCSTEPPLNQHPGEQGSRTLESGHLIRRLGCRAEVEHPGVGTQVVVALPVVSKEALDVAA